jgi:hypothetical protein
MRLGNEQTIWTQASKNSKHRQLSAFGRARGGRRTNGLNVVTRDRVEQPTTERAIKPLKFASIFVRRGLVGLFLARRTPAYCHSVARTYRRDADSLRK